MIELMNSKRNALRGVVTAVLLMVGATAYARVNVDIGIVVPGVYAQPEPVYAPAPVYVVPRPYYAPAPVYVVPRPVYAPRWRGRDDDDDDDDDDGDKRKWRGRGGHGQHGGKHGHHDD